MIAAKRAYTTLDNIIPSAAMPYGCVFYLEIPGYGNLYHVALPERRDPVALLEHDAELYMSANVGTPAPRTIQEIADTEWLDLCSSA